MTIIFKKINLNILIIFFIFIILQIKVFGEIKDKKYDVIKNILDPIMGHLLKYKAEEKKSDFFKKNKILMDNMNITIEILGEYTNSESEDAKWRSIGLLFYLKENNEKKIEYNQRIVEILLNLKKIRIFEKENIYRHLIDSKSSDFSDESKEYIIKEFKKEPTKEIILLIGVAGIKSLIPELKKIIINDKEFDEKYFGTKLSWKCRLALARMGDKEQIEYCIKMVEDYFNKYGFYSLYLRDLEYIRQQEIIRIFYKYLISKERELKNKNGIVSSIYVIELLPKIIEDIPIPKEYSMNEKDFIKVRKWMDERMSFYVIKKLFGKEYKFKIIR